MLYQFAFIGAIIKLAKGIKSTSLIDFDPTGLQSVVLTQSEALSAYRMKTMLLSYIPHEIFFELLDMDNKIFHNLVVEFQFR